MALPKDMRLKGHRTFNYIHKNSTTYYGKLMTFKVVRSNPEILLTHKPTNTSNKKSYAIVLKVLGIARLIFRRSLFLSNGLKKK